MIIDQIKLTIAGGALLAAFGSGWWVRDAFCDAAEAKRDLAAARSELATVKDDLAYAQLAADAARLQSDAIEQQSGQRGEQIRELEDQLAKRPAGGSCRLGADGVRRLRRIAPD